MSTLEPIMSELRCRTHECHKALEEEVDLEQALASIAGYQRMLRKFLSVYLMFEPQLLRTDHLHTWLPDVWERRRIPHLLADLRDLDVSPPAPPDPIPARIHNVAEAFGCLYVLEGSTLGGQMIARQVTERLGLKPDHGCRFFSGGGRDIGALWRAFSSSVEAFAAAQPECREQITHSALATFEAFRYTFASSEPDQETAAKPALSPSDIICRYP